MSNARTGGPLKRKNSSCDSREDIEVAAVNADTMEVSENCLEPDGPDVESL